jgi:nucleotidyltransferase/DNA polymerase involved in DNA repair
VGATIAHKEMDAMELKHIKGIGPAKQQKLKEAGYANVESLARADAAEVAKKTGLSLETAKEYKERAVALILLEDVKGVGPATVQALAESGIRSVKELYEASSERLAKELVVAKDKVQAWQAEAKKLVDHIAVESKTPEGRKRLASEGKEFAQKSARKAQETTMALVERLQKDGELALQKAQELREQAPEKAREYRAKAEEMFREAESRARELREMAERKIQEVQLKAKTEVEKVKTANEGLIARVKAKFQKAE